MLTASAKEAVDLGRSLTLVRPRSPKFIWKAKTKEDLAEERQAFARAASQHSIFDKRLAEIEPTPYDFRFRFEDDGGKHDYSNGDWETHAAFYLQRSRTSEQEALRWLSETYNEDYPKKGMAFVLGNQVKRPQTWQLLGVIRLDHIRDDEQTDLFA